MDERGDVREHVRRGDKKRPRKDGEWREEMRRKGRMKDEM